MKVLIAAVATTLLLASLMMLAAYAYLSSEAQDFHVLASKTANVLPASDEWYASCVESHLTAQHFFRSYGFMNLFGVLPAIFFGTLAGWRDERSGKSQRGQVNTAILTAAVLTLLLVGGLSALFSLGVRGACTRIY